MESKKETILNKIKRLENEIDAYKKRPDSRKRKDLENLSNLAKSLWYWKNFYTKHYA